MAVLVIIVWNCSSDSACHCNSNAAFTLLSYYQNVFISAPSDGMLAYESNHSLMSKLFPRWHELSELWRQRASYLQPMNCSTFHLSSFHSHNEFPCVTASTAHVPWMLLLLNDVVTFIGFPSFLFLLQKFGFHNDHQWECTYVLHKIYTDIHGAMVWVWLECFPRVCCD
jgi:hypothetical protein